VDVDELLTAAVNEAGVDNFGPERDAMLEGLSILVDSVNREAKLSAEGEAMFAATIHSLLTRRLGIEDWHARHPEIGEEEIESILFGIGLPRTGSTALSHLLALDRNVRPLRQWEVIAPTPPPDLATEDTDPRVLAVLAAIENPPEIPVEMRALLPISPDGPAECLDLMSITFRCVALDAMAKTPSYSEWLRHECDFEPAYRFHRRVLKLLQWHRPPSRWRVKSPAHTLSVDALDAVYPQARFVMTHRNAVAVIASVASVEMIIGGMTMGNPDREYIGRNSTDVWDTALRRLLAFRDRVGDDRFYDITFDEMESEPLAAIEGLYAWLGEDLTAETRTAMEAWVERNRTERAQIGSHRYQAEDFGLDREQLRERFAYYEARFPNLRISGSL